MADEQVAQDSADDGAHVEERAIQKRANCSQMPYHHCLEATAHQLVL